MAKVTFVPGSGTLAAYLSGEIDHHAAQTLRREIDAQVDDRLPELLTLDFSGVTFMDSSGVGLILGRGRHVSALGRRRKAELSAGLRLSVALPMERNCLPGCRILKPADLLRILKSMAAYRLYSQAEFRGIRRPTAD